MLAPAPDSDGRALGLGGMGCEFCIYTRVAMLPALIRVALFAPGVGCVFAFAPPERRQVFPLATPDAHFCFTVCFRVIQTLTLQCVLRQRLTGRTPSGRVWHSLRAQNPAREVGAAGRLSARNSARSARNTSMLRVMEHPVFSACVSIIDNPDRANRTNRRSPVFQRSASSMAGQSLGRQTYTSAPASRRCAIHAD